MPESTKFKGFCSIDQRKFWQVQLTIKPSLEIFIKAFSKAALLKISFRASDKRVY